MSDHPVTDAELARLVRTATRTPKTLSPQQLRAWRNRLGLSQGAFADALRALGFATVGRTVRKWELAERRVPAWLARLHETDPDLAGG